MKQLPLSFSPIHHISLTYEHPSSQGGTYESDVSHGQKYGYLHALTYARIPTHPANSFNKFGRGSATEAVRFDVFAKAYKSVTCTYSATT